MQQGASRARITLKTGSTPPHRPWTAILFILGIIALGLGLWYVLAPQQPRDWFAEQPAEAPPPPQREAPAEQSEAPAEVKPSFDVVRITRGGTGVIAGRAAPGAEVEILADGETIGKVRADERGEWVLIFEQPLGTGPSELSLVTRRADGEALESEQVVVVVVPERGDERFFDSGEGVMAVMTPRDGQGPSTILQRPTGSVDFGGGLMVETLDYDAEGAATFAGRAAARSEVRLFLNNELLGATKADDRGRWTFNAPAEIPEGDHILRLDQMMAEGKVQLRIEVPFTRGLPLDVTRAEGSIIVQPGNNLWTIARRLYGVGYHYTLIFGLNKDQIRDPDLIYPEQKFTLPKQAPGSDSDVPEEPGSSQPAPEQPNSEPSGSQ